VLAEVEDRMKRKFLEKRKVLLAREARAIDSATDTAKVQRGNEQILLELRIKLHAESIPTRQAAKDFTLVFMVSLGIVS